MNSKWNAEVSRAFLSLNCFNKLNASVSWTTLFAYAVVAVLLFYYILQSLDYYPLLTIPEQAWNFLVYLAPSSLVVALDKRTNTKITGLSGSLGSFSSSRTFAAKSEAMRYILGLDGKGMLGSFQRARSLSGMTSIIKAPLKSSLPGLGNWDNSCYQNSVIQSLAALPSLSYFLTQTISANAETHGPSTTIALRDVIEDLNNPANAGQRLWTPAELKTMSSWQQQDAQEYYSKVLDQVDKEASRSVMKKRISPGLRKIGRLEPALTEPADATTSGNVRCRFDLLPEELVDTFLSNPLEGLLAQRVGCLKCGFVEGISLIPFNCLTVPLGKQWEYDVQSCLDEYTTLESISGVECSKCTLLRHKEQLERLLQLTQTSPEDIPNRPQISETLHHSASTRLCAVHEALENEDFSEVTLKKCQIPVKGRVETTKSKQAVIARLPKALTIHVNRSVFNERTGALSKNQASVRFPKLLDLTPWCLGNSASSGREDTMMETWNADPSSSMIPDIHMDEAGASSSSDSNLFVLRAIITHYGRHENGHYICYRTNPQDNSVDEVREHGGSWWRLSDDEVSEVSEEVVLDQRGVFMLFYERVQSAQTSPATNQPITESSRVIDIHTICAIPLEQDKNEQQGYKDVDQPTLETPMTTADKEGLLLPVTIDIPSRCPGQAPSESIAESLFPAIINAPREIPLQETMRTGSIGENNPNVINANLLEDIKAGDKPLAADADGKENRRSPRPMRTAGVRNFDRPGTGNGMASISSMVTAN